MVIYGTERGKMYVGLLVCKPTSKKKVPTKMLYSKYLFSKIYFFVIFYFNMSKNFILDQFSLIFNENILANDTY